MAECTIRFEKLVDFVDSKLDDAGVQSMRLHLESGCSDCSARIGQLQRFMTAAAAGALEMPSDVVMRQAKGIYRDRFSAPVRKSLFALLVHDSRLTGAPLGARAASVTSTHLIYTADDLDLDLWQEPAQGDRWHLMGQALQRNLHEPVTPISASLSNKNVQIPMAITNNTLSSESIPTGEYSLDIDLGAAGIVHAHVRVGN